MPQRKDSPWEGIEPERVELARAVLAAAKRIAEEDGDGEVADLSEATPGFRAVGSGFNRLVSKAASGELDEDDPESMVDALRVASAAMVDVRQPQQYQGFRWLTGQKEPLVPEDWQFNFTTPEFKEAVERRRNEQPFGPQETEQVGFAPRGKGRWRTIESLPPRTPRNIEQHESAPPEASPYIPKGFEGATSPLRTWTPPDEGVPAARNWEEPPFPF